MAQAALDVYGFELNMSQEEAQARQACEAKQNKRAGKWEAYFKQGKLPPASKLKKYCREVCLASSQSFRLLRLCNAAVDLACQREVGTSWPHSRHGQCCNISTATDAP